MKFTIKKNNDLKEYDEMMYILENIKRIHKNPHKKVKSFTNNYIKLFIFELLILLLNLFLLKNGKFWYIYLGVFIMIIFISVIMFINGRMRMKYHQKNSCDTTISSDAEEIKMENKNYTYTFKWNDIKYIISNKHSISIIPESLPGLVVCLPIDAKTNVIKMIKKYKKENIFIDNEELYK